MDDIVLSHRSVTGRDSQLRALIAQLRADELEEAIGLLEDLIRDRERPARADDRLPVVSLPAMVAD